VKYSISYLTRYRYTEEVFDQHNVLRVRPADTPTQHVETFRMSVDPAARLFTHSDYYGTHVVEFNVPEAHSELRIEAEAGVATTPPPRPPGGGWDALASPAYREAAGEFALLAGDEPANGQLDSLKAAVDGAAPAAAVDRICELIPDRFEYRPGATYVGSTVDDLLAAGGGVCQDFVHLALILLRTRGIAARYVSGYFFAAPGDVSDGVAEEGDTIEVSTHAWVEALLPGGDGEVRWVAADPTNHTLADDRHVKIGHGRHYGDVPPIKGAYRGAPDAEQEVSVRMTRVGGD
jgi:transglutaminase-like putative cysteine protease